MSIYDYRACSCGRFSGPCPIHTYAQPGWSWTSPNMTWTTMGVYPPVCTGRHCAEHA